MTPPVVLVHGLTGSTHWWDSTIEALAPRYEVHVARLGGFRYREATERLLRWLDEERLTGATVVGHSMGGTIALLAAAEAPSAVGRLALIAPAGIFESRARRSFVLPIVRSVGGSGGRFTLMLRDVARIGAVQLWRVASDLLGADVGAALRAVRVPTLIVWGAEDRLLPVTLGAVFASQIADSRLVVLERCAHIPMLEAPEALNEALLQFLDERADARR